MHSSLKIIKTLLYSYSALHVSGTLAPIIRSLVTLHIQPPVTYQLKTYCLCSNHVEVCYYLQFVFHSYFNFLHCYKL
jgi:hypothetical protein